MEARRILIIGNYGAGNLGDDAICAGIIQELKQLDMTSQIKVTHGGFPTSEDIYHSHKKVAFAPTGIRSSFASTRNQCAEGIKWADLVILGGGGLFVDTESIKAPQIWAKHAQICVDLNTPYICYGQSIGPLNETSSQDLTRDVFREAKGMHVRDHGSVEELNRLGLTNGVWMGTDPAFSYLQTLPKNNDKKPILLVSLRQWTGSVNEQWAEIMDEVNAAAETLGLEVKLIAMDLRNKKEIEALKSYGELIQVKSASEAYSHFQSASLACTMRLHAGIFALAAGTPVVALSYSQKVASLFNSVEAEGAQVLSLKDLHKGQVQKALLSLKGKASSARLKPLQEENLNFLKHQLDL